MSLTQWPCGGFWIALAPGDSATASAITKATKNPRRDMPAAFTSLASSRSIGLWYVGAYPVWRLFTDDRRQSPRADSPLHNNALRTDVYGSRRVLPLPVPPLIGGRNPLRPIHVLAEVRVGRP